MLSVGAGNIASNVAGEIHNRCIQRLVTLAVAHCVVGPRGRTGEPSPEPCFLRYAVRVREPDACSFVSQMSVGHFENMYVITHDGSSESTACRNVRTEGYIDALSGPLAR